MNPAQLLDHFDRISDVPDAISCLRRFVLDLAVRGKLVEQDPRDEPASEMLKRIQTEKARLVKTGEKRKEEPLPELCNEDRFFKLPSGWGWVRFGEIYSLEYGDNLPAERRSNTGEYPVYGSNGIVGSHSVCFVNEPCIVVGRKGSAGALNLSLAGGCCVTDVAYYCVPPHGLDLAFTFKLFHTLGLDTLGKGIKPGLNRNDAYLFPLALPPLAEQQRIVAKVDELMALCDRLELAQTERESQRDRLAAASLHRLHNGASADAFRDHARFYFNHLPRLTTRPEHIRQLRQSILNLAVRGKLVLQDPNDEPASELLSTIAKKRSKLLEQDYPNESEGSTQLRKQQNQFLPDGLEPLPHGWHWATLMQCSLLVVDCHNKTAPYSNSGIILLRTTNVRDGKLNLNEPKFVNEQAYKRWSARCQPEPGDILVTREAPMGEVCIIPNGMKICLGQRMMLVRLVSDTIDPQFMLYSLRDPGLMNRVQDKPVGATVQHLRVGGVETLLVPLPPLAEQQRVVAKADELMTLCDRLEAQLTTAQTDSHRFLDAVLHEALGFRSKSQQAVVA